MSKAELIITVALTMLVSSLLAATFIVAGIEFLYEKIGSKKHEKKNSNSLSDNNTTK